MSPHTLLLENNCFIFIINIQNIYKEKIYFVKEKMTHINNYFFIFTFNHQCLGRKLIYNFYFDIQSSIYKQFNFKKFV